MMRMHIATAAADRCLMLLIDFETPSLQYPNHHNHRRLAWPLHKVNSVLCPVTFPCESAENKIIMGFVTQLLGRPHSADNNTCSSSAAAVCSHLLGSGLILQWQTFDSNTGKHPAALAALPTGSASN
jgi:hypothetical protein